MHWFACVGEDYCDAVEPPRLELDDTGTGGCLTNAFESAALTLQND